MNFLLSTGGIIGIVVFITIVLIVLLVLLYIFIIVPKLKSKKIKDLETRYYYFHSLLLGECYQILQRIEIISHSNLIYSQIHSENLKIYLEINQSEEKKAQNALDLIEDYKLNPKKKGFKLCYANSSATIDNFIKKVSDLKQKLANIIKPEEDARNEAFKVKEKETYVKKMYIQNRTLFNLASSSIDLLFDKIDQKFLQFEDLIDQAQYDDALKILPKLEKIIDELSRAITILPDLCLYINDEYNKELENIKQKISKLENAKIPLYSINPKKRIKSFKDQIEKISHNVSLLKLNHSKIEIENLKNDMKDLNYLIDNEVEASDFYNNNFITFLDEYKTLTKRIITIYNRIPNYSKIYFFNDTYSNIINQIQEKERVLSANKTSLDLSTLSTNKQPYSVISDKLKKLKISIDDTNSLIQSFEDYVLSLKNDCELAFKLIKESSLILKEYETKLYNLNLNNKEDYESRFNRCFTLLNNLTLILKNNPIDVISLNRDKLEFNTLKESLTTEIDEYYDFINKINKMFISLNQIRDGFSDVDADLKRAEELYNECLYKDCYITIKTIFENKKDLLKNTNNDIS